MPMSAGQFRQCLGMIRWTQTVLAEEMGVPALKVRKWSAGLEPIPDMVAEWVRAWPLDWKLFTAALHRSAAR
jgi:hypothetical protein